MPTTTSSKKTSSKKVKKTSPLAKKKPPKKLTPTKKTTLKTKSSRSKNQKKITEVKKELENLNNKSKETILIKDAEGMLYCQHENCDQPAVTDLFCRYHYLEQWPRLYNRKQILKENYLSQEIQKLISHFGEPTLSFLIKDFKTKKAFDLVVKEMNLIPTNSEDAPPSKEEDN